MEFEDFINKFNVKDLTITRNENGTYNLFATIDGYDKNKRLAYNVIANKLSLDYSISVFDTNSGRTAKHSLSLEKSIRKDNEGIFYDIVLCE